ncbi:hypothetical protein [Amycolatopsis sp. NPDC059657]|uniref:hypothetical protein n=1 Tax=Amycolatopsis sp. NPDC059657 TaxID=3346899 RepID=UPI0036733FE8
MVALLMVRESQAPQGSHPQRLKSATKPFHGRTKSISRAPQKRLIAEHVNFNDHGKMTSAGCRRLRWLIFEMHSDLH